jgi:CDGSH-type Zn-finger protein
MYVPIVSTGKIGDNAVIKNISKRWKCCSCGSESNQPWQFCRECGKFNSYESVKGEPK